MAAFALRSLEFFLEPLAVFGGLLDFHTSTVSSNYIMSDRTAAETHSQRKNLPYVNSQ